LSNLFKKELKITFAHYLNMKRVEKAKLLITKTELELSEIKDKVGFTTDQHFFKEFKKHTGRSPKMFRQN